MDKRLVAIVFVVVMMLLCGFTMAAIDDKQCLGEIEQYFSKAPAMPGCEKFNDPAYISHVQNSITCFKPWVAQVSLREALNIGYTRGGPATHNAVKEYYDCKMQEMQQRPPMHQMPPMQQGGRYGGW